MQMILPGLWHWTTIHERWGIEISSYHLAAEELVIDPRVPAEGLDRFRAAPPSTVLLTCRHHLRDAVRFAQEFGSRILCNRAGLHEFGAGHRVEGFDPGDELPGGVRAVAIDAISPDETALFIPALRALAVADGVVREPPDGPLGFVPDRMMDDPERTKAGLRAAFARALELDWVHLLPAHGHPILDDGDAALRRFLDGER